MRIKPNTTLLFVGDSITDVGRSRPVGEGLDGGLGAGYPHLVAAHLASFRPELNIRVLNTGVDGDTTRELRARWQTDVLDFAPDYVSAMIGINDCRRHFDNDWGSALRVGLDEYAENLRALVVETLSRVRGMFLMTPQYFVVDRTDPMRAAMDAYRGVMHAVAQTCGVPCFDTQAYVDRALKTPFPCRYSADRVHPNAAGHLLLARSFLDGANLW